MSSSYHLDVWDYVTGTFFVLISCGAGVYHVLKSGKYTDFKRFLVSSDELGLIPIILSNISTGFSAISMLGYATEAYMNGIIFFMAVIGCWINIVFGAYIYLPVFYRLPTNTIFEYLELRFSNTVKMFMSFPLFLQLLFYSGVVIYGPSLVVSQVTGLDFWTSVISVTTLCTVYTAFGGFKAVVWADVVQALVMFLFLLLIVIIGLVDGGGFVPVWEKLKNGRRLEFPFWSFDTDLLNSFWTMSVGYPCGLIIFFALNQSIMQRCKSCPNLKKAQIALTGGLFGVSCLFALSMTAGLLIYAHYFDCDPLLNGDIKVRDQLLPLYTTQIFSNYKGLSGIFVAGVLSATLSTLSSNLNSLAVITISDFILFFKPHLSDKSSIKISRLLILLYGGVCLAVVSLCENMGGIIAATFAVCGTCSGPIVAVFTMGVLLPWVNSTGALIGFFCSMVLPVWALVGKMLTSPVVITLPLSSNGCSNYSAMVTNVTEVIESENFFHEFYSLSTFWYSCWSLGIGLITSLIASKLTGFPDLSQVNPQLYCSFVMNYISKIQTKVANDEPKNAENTGNRPLMEAYKLQ